MKMLVLLCLLFVQCFFAAQSFRAEEDKNFFPPMKFEDKELLLQMLNNQLPGILEDQIEFNRETRERPNDPYLFGLGKRSTESDLVNFNGEVRNKNSKIAEGVEGSVFGMNNPSRSQSIEEAARTEKSQKPSQLIEEATRDQERNFYDNFRDSSPASYFNINNPKLKVNAYDFGLGKHKIGLGKREIGSNKRGPKSYSFGLGKRDEYGFGLGKRENQYTYGLRKEDPKFYGVDLGKRGRNDYGFGLGKRGRNDYGFGLGKRGKNDYEFGLGKRGKNDYGFGLGKRNSQNLYRYGLDKPRSNFAFGLGKRNDYNFGLGKRNVVYSEPENVYTSLLQNEPTDSLFKPSRGVDLYDYLLSDTELLNLLLNDAAQAERKNKILKKGEKIYEFGLGKRSINEDTMAEKVLKTKSSDGNSEHEKNEKTKETSN